MHQSAWEVRKVPRAANTSLGSRSRQHYCATVWERGFASPGGFELEASALEFALVG